MQVKKISPITCQLTDIGFKERLEKAWNKICFGYLGKNCPFLILLETQQASKLRVEIISGCPCKFLLF